MSFDSPLSCRISQDGTLTISIGIGTLKFATDNDDAFFDGTKYTVLVTDPAAFAKAVLTELKHEAEDGSTMVHLMFDKAIENAVDHGAEGITLV